MSTPNVFEEIYRLYPKRDGSQRKKEGMAVLAKLEKAGKLEDIRNAVQHYAAHCKRRGLTGTDKVLQFKTFLSNVWEEWLPAAPIVTPSETPPAINPDDMVKVMEVLKERLRE